MKSIAQEIVHKICRLLKEEYNISVNSYLVGSGSKNLITKKVQYGFNDRKISEEPVDLDYNLEIIKCDKNYDAQKIRKCVYSVFRKVLSEYVIIEWMNCYDKKSVINSGKLYLNFFYDYRIHYQDLPFYNLCFEIEICITYKENKNQYLKLVYDSNKKEYYWNQSPNYRKTMDRASYIKKKGKWNLLRDTYLYKKNMYLERNDEFHPSYICYAESVNEVYNKIINKK